MANDEYKPNHVVKMQDYVEPTLVKARELKHVTECFDAVVAGAAPASSQPV